MSERWSRGKNGGNVNQKKKFISLQSHTIIIHTLFLSFQGSINKIGIQNDGQNICSVNCQVTFTHSLALSSYTKYILLSGMMVKCDKNFVVKNQTW